VWFSYLPERQLVDNQSPTVYGHLLPDLRLFESLELSVKEFSMSHYPNPPQTVVVQQAPGTSGLAIAGLIFSILGWFTCGLLCIPGAFFCLLALFARGPKGAAIAGLIVGFPGTLFFAFVGLGLIMSFLGIGAAATSVIADAENTMVEAQSEMQQHAIDEQQSPVEQSPEPAETTTSESPDEIVVDPVVQPPSIVPPESDLSPPPSEPDMPEEETHASDRAEAAKWRTWTTADGKYRVEAKLVTLVAGTLTLEKRDGTTVNVKLDILSPEDQDFVTQRK